MPATHTLDGIALHADMIWTDEFDWLPVESDMEFSLTGALIIDSGTRQAGRPITLAADDSRGWSGMTRTKLLALRAKAAVPGATYPLTLADGRAFTVAFRPGGEAITARQVWDRALPPADWPYILTLRLTEV
jgi:hypothetical protein